MLSFLYDALAYCEASSTIQVATKGGSSRCHGKLYEDYFERIERGQMDVCETKIHK